MGSYILFRLDNHFEARRKEMTDITLPPSEYFKRQCVICSLSRKRRSCARRWTGSAAGTWLARAIIRTGIQRRVGSRALPQELSRHSGQNIVNFFSRAAIEALALA